MNFENHVEEKNVFHFNEVTSIVGVKPYVLRFWESEFTQISPRLDSKGQKLYDSNDLQQINKIKNLLFEDKYSIQQAKNVLDQELQLAMAQKEADLKTELTVEVQTKDPETTNIVQVEELETPQHVISKTSSFDIMKMALGEKLKSAEAKQELEQVNIQRQISDKDIVHLVQAKKKLTSVLSKIDQLVETRSW